MDNLTCGEVQYEERTHNDDDDEQRLHVDHEQRLPVDHEPAASTIDVVDKFNIGFTPVDLRGRPLLDLSNTGGWRAALFIFGRYYYGKLILWWKFHFLKYLGILKFSLISVEYHGKKN
jgi:hypothetical protein